MNSTGKQKTIKDIENWINESLKSCINDNMPGIRDYVNSVNAPLVSFEIDRMTLASHAIADH